MSDFDAFDQIVDDLEHLSNPFYVLFQQARQQLQHEQPEGFDVAEIGARAWARLPMHEWPAAFRSLFVAYWQRIREEERETALQDAALASGRMYLTDSPYAHLQDAVSAGPDPDGGVSLVFEDLVALLAEVDVLRRRMKLLRDVLVGEPDRPF